MNRYLRRGFTLIEITIVLGIASLVIALVFMSVAGAQRSSRDTTRRADTQKLATAVEAWGANHNGSLPAAADLTNLTSQGYLDNTKFKDPSTGGNYNIIIKQDMAAVDAAITYAGCWPSVMFYVYDPASPTNYFVVTCLEQGKYTYKP